MTEIYYAETNPQSALQRAAEPLKLSITDRKVMSSFFAFLWLLVSPTKYSCTLPLKNIHEIQRNCSISQHKEFSFIVHFKLFKKKCLNCDYLQFIGNKCRLSLFRQASVHLFIYIIN